ncbi:hypothetical protein WICPIJ_010139, partial [Wickerhamomyces pijperi]
APEEPVPESLTTNLKPLDNLAYKPWLLETEPSKSVYEKSPVSVKVTPSENSWPLEDSEVASLAKLSTNCLAPSLETFSKSNLVKKILPYLAQNLSCTTLMDTSSCGCNLCTETLFTTDRQLLGIEQSAEELPTSWHLINVQALILSNQVQSTGGRHGSGQTVDTLLLEVWDEISVLGNDSHRVTWRDKGPSTVDHVSITVTVRGSTEGNVFSIDSVNQSLSVC